MNNKGYRGMIRDRMPYILDVVLRYFGMKNKWVSHVYDNFVKIFKSNVDKDMAVRVTLGIASRYSIFVYDRSIKWDNLTEEEQKYWEAVGKVYEWLQKYHITLEQSYKSLKYGGVPFDECVDQICERFNLTEYKQFVKFVLLDLK